MSTSDPPSSPLAYKKDDFLDSDDARPLRILAEYLGPMHAFHRAHIRDTIVFFGSARLAAEGPQTGIAAELEEEMPAIAHSKTAER